MKVGPNCVQTKIYTRRIARFTVGVLVIFAAQFSHAGEDFTSAIREVLRDNAFDNGSPGTVIGLIDENGPKVIAFGKTDGPNSADVNGDTIFEIGSVTKTFTALLLVDMIERGEMRLDDPVSKYLPKSVGMPARSGKEITLLQLATHTSGLPCDPDNLTPGHWPNYYEGYTVDQLYAFLSGHTLVRDPGNRLEYSNLGFGLLGHVIARKAGTDFESLLLEGICGPLKMESTRTTMTPALRKRAAVGHDYFGAPTGDMMEGILVGCGGIHSTANDMLKYLSANLGLTHSRLTPLMEKAQEPRLKHRTQDGADSQGLAWISQDRNIFWHGGGTWGFSAIAEVQKKQRRGIVILCNMASGPGIYPLSRLLLNKDWQMPKRPGMAAIDHRIYDSYVGRYQLTSNCVMGIRRDGNRLLAQLTDDLFFELLPESATDFLVKITGKSVSFVRDGNGKVVSLRSDMSGTAATFIKISDEQPNHMSLPKAPVFVKVDQKALDAFQGTYQFPSRKTITLRREGDHLIWDHKRSVAEELYAESETKISCPNIPIHVSLLKDDKGAALGVMVSCPAPDFSGRASKIHRQ